MSSKFLMNTYKPLDVSFSHGQGMELFDQQGNRYLDAIAGIATCSLGHAHPAVSAALCSQAEKLIHCSNIYHIEQQQMLAEKLCKVADMDRAFFCNSGAEANEAAIKLARKHAFVHDIDKPQIIVLDHAFHGRTLASLSASGNPKIHRGFSPLVEGFLRAPVNNIKFIEKLIHQHHVVAVMLEPTQGEGGVRLLSGEYLKAIASLCRQHDLLLIFDEIQTGNGRTGNYFAYQQFKILPDIVTTAKGLGNGFPIGACLAQGKAANLFEPGNHGSTFGGNPLACATALAVVNTITEQKLAHNAKLMGDYLLQQFEHRIGHLASVVEIRGHGLMIGIELDQECAALVEQALEIGLLINVTATKVVRLLPALIIDQTHADEILDKLCPLIENFSDHT